MVVAGAFIGQTGLVQNAVDPDPGPIRERPTKITDKARADCGSSASNSLGHCSGAYRSHFALSARKAGGPAGDGYDLWTALPV